MVTLVALGVNNQVPVSTDPPSVKVERPMDLKAKWMTFAAGCCIGKADDESTSAAGCVCCAEDRGGLTAMLLDSRGCSESNGGCAR